MTIQQSDKQKEAKGHLKSSKLRRLYRKKEAERHNSLREVRTSLSPNEYTWDRKCKKKNGKIKAKCHGTGIIGMDVVNNRPILCQCAKKVKKKKEEAGTEK